MQETVVGETPLDPERIPDKFGHTHYTASGGIGWTAIAAIETTCWDVKGKVLDAPVYELIGGEYRTRIPLYSDTEALTGESTDIDFTEEYAPETYAEAAREVVSLGFTALKFNLAFIEDPVCPEKDSAQRRV